MPHLFVLAGFEGHWEAIASKLREQYRPHEIEFFGRDRPQRWRDNVNAYRDSVAADLVKKIFGPTATDFCSQDGSCTVGQKRWSRASCKRSIGEQTACSRLRPDMLVFVCPEELYQSFFRAFGRAALFVRLPSATATAAEIGSQIERNLPAVRRIKEYLANLSNTNFAPRVPMLNYQSRVPTEIALSAQADLSLFCEVMNDFHRQLYDSSFINPVKKYMRGAYMLNADVGFQRDRLHHSAKLGKDSREHAYHLINAFHMYGFAVRPGWHFDVVREDGRALRVQFQDCVTGKRSAASATHVNVSPCDRVL